MPKGSGLVMTFPSDEKGKTNTIQQMTSESPKRSGCGVRSSLYCSAKSAPFSSSEMSLSGLDFSPVCECGCFCSQQYQGVKYPPGRGAAASQCKLTLPLQSGARWGAGSSLKITDVLCSHESIFWNVTVENTSKHFVFSDSCHFQPCSVPFLCVELHALLVCSVLISDTQLTQQSFPLPCLY